MKYLNCFIFIILILLISSCGIYKLPEYRGYEEERTEQITATDIYGVATKISYDIYTSYYNGQQSGWGVFLYNGYDKPVEAWVKFIWAGSVPTYYKQYIHGKQEAQMNFSNLGYTTPIKIEIYSIVYK